MKLVRSYKNRVWQRPSARHLVFAVVLCMVATSYLTSEARAQSDGQKLFESRCYSCHNIGGGDKQGPDLKGLTDRRTKEWISEFTKSPVSMKGKDPVAADLFQKFAPTIMPDQSLSPEELDALITLIRDLSTKNEMFVPAGAKLAREIVPDDIPAGQKLFTGQVRLANGAAACNSCHSVNGVGALGGGTLGPDLTAVNIKYRDPELITILQNPNFPTMNTIFKDQKLTDEEVVEMFAYLQHLKQMNPNARVVPTQAAATIEPRFLILGFGITTFALIGMNLFWRKRSHGVRKQLVRRAKI